MYDEEAVYSQDDFSNSTIVLVPLGPTEQYFVSEQYDKGYKEEQQGDLVFVDHLYENKHFIHSNKWNLFFTIYTLVGIAIIIWCFIPSDDNVCYASGFGNWVALGLTGAGILIYWIESFCCSASCKYLNDVVDPEGIQVHINTIKTKSPSIHFTIECYHYETYTTTTTDANGNVTTQTRTERVVTYRETQPFRYSEWDDISGELIGVGAKYRVTKVRFSKKYVFADEHTRNCWEAAYNDIQSRNRHRDVHMDAWHGFSINGYRGRMLAMVNPDEPPMCLKLVWYVLSSLVLFGYCFRSWFHSISTKQRFKYIKRVKCK